MPDHEPPAALDQDPHAGARGDRDLEAAIGSQIRHHRRQLDMTVTELAAQAGVSSGMLSKIENGHTSPSLGTLQRLVGALNVPFTALFQRFEEQRDASHVRAGRASRSNAGERAPGTSTHCSATVFTRRLPSNPT